MGSGSKLNDLLYIFRKKRILKHILNSPKMAGLENYAFSRNNFWFPNTILNH